SGGDHGIHSRSKANTVARRTILTEASIVNALDNMNTAAIDAGSVILSSRGKTGRPSPVEDHEKMARRRFQNPRPEKLGKFWYIRLWQDEFAEEVRTRKRKRVQLAPATKKLREVQRIAADYLRPF